jgi:hypothetical protein
LIYGQELWNCIASVFRDDAANIPTQTLANAPVLNANFNANQLAVAFQQQAPTVVGENNPNLCPNGTVYIANEIFNCPNTLNAIFGTFVHELRNVLDEQMNPPGTTGGQPYGGTYGNKCEGDDDGYDCE